MVPIYVNLGNRSNKTFKTSDIKYYECSRRWFNRRRYPKCTEFFLAALLKKALGKKPNWKFKTIGKSHPPSITFFFKDDSSTSIDFESDIQMEKYRMCLVQILSGQIKEQYQINVVYYMYNKSKFDME